MKKLMFILVAVTLGLTTSISAKKAPAVATNLPTNFKTEVAKHIAYPAHAQNNMVQGVVSMRVTLDNENKVKIVELSATNPELGEHVKNELSNLKIENTSFKPGNVYYMNVRFNLIKSF